MVFTKQSVPRLSAVFWESRYQLFLVQYRLMWAFFSGAVYRSITDFLENANHLQFWLLSAADCSRGGNNALVFPFPWESHRRRCWHKIVGEIQGQISSHYCYCFFVFFSMEIVMKTYFFLYHFELVLGWKNNMVSVCQHLTEHPFNNFLKEWYLIDAIHW